MEATISYQEQREIRNKTAKPLLWIGIVSMLMLFAGLTSAYIVRIADGNWVYFDLPKVFYLSTGIIIASSVLINFAMMSVKRNHLTRVKLFLFFTLLLGFGFVFSQFYAWKSLVDQGVFLVGNVSGSFLYVLSGLHLLHLVGGIIFLTVILIKALLGHYNSEKKLGMELCATYWHFLDVLWIYLFLFFVFIQ